MERKELENKVKMLEKKIEVEYVEHIWQDTQLMIFVIGAIIAFFVIVIINL